MVRFFPFNGYEGATEFYHPDVEKGSSLGLPDTTSFDIYNQRFLWRIIRSILNYGFSGNLIKYKRCKIINGIVNFVVSLHHQGTFSTIQSMRSCEQLPTSIARGGKFWSGFMYLRQRTSWNSIALRSNDPSGHGWCSTRQIRNLGLSGVSAA